ncbi:cadherin-related family member 4 isoform X3 [Pezoporus flaviventris]|uniref:cadherin-related family member 4 isoform X3 n=1 Tax=Pezoporus flaviventris TaxID=889875 RepID=UPI002AAF4D53|nr:cadherin-related family member 4 isoform X3 [Pezoporus flaviventris]
MGMHGRLTFLLLSLCAPGTFVRAAALLDLPCMVTLSEDAVPGTSVAEVTVSCSNTSDSPNVTLHGTEPSHPFSLITSSTDPMANTTFQVTLRAGAELNAHWMNMYTLTLRATCPGEDEVEKQLFVWVKGGQVLHCNAPFTSTAGDVVRVLADVAPRTPLYAVMPQPLGGLTFRLRNHNTPLVLTDQGLVLAPAGGFDPSKGTQTFRLEIEVMDSKGHNCSGAVSVEVLPSCRPCVSFLEPQQAVTVPGVIGPLEVVTQVRASGDNVRYAILAPTAPTFFTIDEMTGKIHSTRQLEVAQEQLLVQAYNALHPDDHATTILNITVQGTDQQELSCVPAIFVSQVPETELPGSTLVTLRCTGCEGAEGCLRYALEGPPASRSHFRMEGPQLQVSTTLDYDSKAVATVGFQFTATIVVTAGGQPPRSTRVPMLVTLTPVNEFTPVCPNGTTFTVPETAAFGSAVGLIAGTDRDYPPDSLEYSLEGGPGPEQPFSIDVHTGEIRVVGPLDSRQRKSYRLTVRLTDTRNDLDPAKQRSCLCAVTVHVQQAVLDQAPVCIPEVQELWIIARSGSRQPVTRLACQGSRDGTTLTYNIAGGNEDGRFQLEGNTVLYLPNNLPEPRTFVLLVEVSGGSGTSRHSTVVALVVHITPRSTPVPPSTTTQRTTPLKERLVVTRVEAVWRPPAWFVAVLTVSGALLLATLGCMARSLLCSNRVPGKLLLGKSPWDVVEQKGDEGEPGSSHASSMEQFDGRAQDPALPCSSAPRSSWSEAEPLAFLTGRKSELVHRQVGVTR